MIDKVVAIVNDDIITLSELEAETGELYQSIAKVKSGEELQAAISEVREKTLDSMIDQRLVEQRAALYNITVTDDEVDAAFSGVRQKAGLDSGEFLRRLQLSGYTEESYRKNIYSSLLQNKLLAIDVKSKIIVSDEEVLDYYDQNYTSRMEEDGYYLLQIGFNWKDGDLDDKKRAFELATRVHKMARDGDDFHNLARKYSELPSAVDGGDIGVFMLDEMVPAMRSGVAGLSPGEISDIIQTPAGYQFFKLLSNNNEAIVTTAPYEAVENEIREKLYQTKLEEAFRNWVIQLKDKAYIQKL